MIVVSPVSCVWPRISIYDRKLMRSIERMDATVARALQFLGLIISLVLMASSAVDAGSTNYEPIHPPRILPATKDARSFYAEFRAREEAGGFGHSYIALGSVGSNGEERQTVVAGFMPRSMIDDYWSQFGIPVAGVVGVVRSDFVRRADARFRIAISKANYYRIVSRIQEIRRTWRTYELLLSNCNNFVSEVANTTGLRTPLLAAQLPVAFVSELRTLNSR
jgi:hypothetical protein